MSSEIVLLKWLQLHYNKVYPKDARRVTNLSSDLRDGVVLAALFKSHVPGCKALKMINPPAAVPADEVYLSFLKKKKKKKKSCFSSLAFKEGHRRVFALLVLFILPA